MFYKASAVWRAHGRRGSGMRFRRKSHCALALVGSSPFWRAATSFFLATVLFAED